MKMKLVLNKSILIIITIGCLWVPFFMSCVGSKIEDIDSVIVDVTVNNPNEDSELTLLMHQVYEDADSIKSAIKEGTGSITEEFIEELEYVHKAIPSDPKLSNSIFTAFNELIIIEAKALQTTTINKTEGFNKLVNRCIDCHKIFCPGPIPRIKKLKI